MRRTDLPATPAYVAIGCIVTATVSGVALFFVQTVWLWLTLFASVFVFFTACSMAMRHYRSAVPSSQQFRDVEKMTADEGR